VNTSLPGTTLAVAEEGRTLVEIASILATGILRLLLNGAVDAPTPDVSATCGHKDPAHHGHEELDVSPTQRNQL